MRCLRSQPRTATSRSSLTCASPRLRKGRPTAKALKGFSGRGVLEIVEDHDGNAYRAVYTVRLEGAIYVLPAFQKKSKKGSTTPVPDIELIKKRLTRAEEHHRERSRS